MKKIIIDTNVFLNSYKFKLDIIQGLTECCDFNFNLFILKCSINELKNLAKKNPNDVSVRFSLSLVEKWIKNKKIKVIKNDSYVDDKLIEMAEEGYIVLTSDKNVIKEVSKLNMPHLTFRQRKKIILIGHVKSEHKN